MTLQEIRAVVAKLEFSGTLKMLKAKVTVHTIRAGGITPTPYDSVFFGLEVCVPTTVEGKGKRVGDMIPLQLDRSDYYLTQFEDEERVVQTVFSLLREMLLHELDEGFLYEGKNVNEPHPELRKVAV